MLNNYKVLEKSTTKHTAIGNAAEALVQKYYGQPINATPREKPDEGWDLLVNGARTDVKSQANTVDWFGSKTCT